MIKWLQAIEHGSIPYYLVCWFGILFAIFCGIMAIVFPIVCAEFLPIWLLIFIDILFVCGTAFFAAISSFMLIEY